jgi:hypothetical protein
MTKDKSGGWWMHRTPLKYFKLKNYIGYKNGYRFKSKGLNCYNLTFEEANELLYNEKE